VVKAQWVLAGAVVAMLGGCGGFDRSDGSLTAGALTHTSAVCPDEVFLVNVGSNVGGSLVEFVYERVDVTADERLSWLPGATAVLELTGDVGRFEPRESSYSEDGDRTSVPRDRIDLTCSAPR
jgi:hypothetical protein